jgi:hypothetical protein
VAALFRVCSETGILDQPIPYIAGSVCGERIVKKTDRACPVRNFPWRHIIRSHECFRKNSHQVGVMVVHVQE